MTARTPILVNDSMRFNIPDNNNITWRRIIGDGSGLPESLSQSDLLCIVQAANHIRQGLNGER